MYLTLMANGTETGHSFTTQEAAFTAAIDMSNQAAAVGFDSVILVATSTKHGIATFKNGQRVKAETV